MSVSEELLAIMACPLCRAPLVDRGETLECTGCRVQYPVRDGIPVMLPEEAIPPSTGEGGS
ncbi:MAG: Trm112 family protein [Actinobacteria bacterium]|nr:Trm112 family protein [Actinomycetota bacterium]MBU1493958.1 Trm112 family protein [Actinomycetota bacterium]MBU1865871.1 Trm112 family protein [Actinomycetota bacterium]